MPRGTDRASPPKVSEFMTGVPATVDEDLSLQDAAERMFLSNIRHLPIMRAGRLIGVLSSRDVAVLTSLPGVDARTTRVSYATDGHLYECGPDAPVDEVAREMEAHRYGAAVVTEQGNPVGIFTTTDALRALRQLVAGHEVERQVSATHVVDVPAERERVEHHVRMGDLTALPEPSMGRKL
jgi:acetoin utilization protein AcuB